MSERVLRSAPVALLCALVWVLLHGDLSVVNVIWGGLIGVGLVVAFPVDRSAPRHRVHPWAAVRWVGFVLWSLVVSSWQVARLIVRPTPARLRAAVVRVPLVSDSPVTTTMVANAITMTPGTVTLTASVGPPELHVHAIGVGDLDQFRATIHDLERRTLAALEPLHPGSDPGCNAGER